MFAVLYKHPEAGPLYLADLSVIGSRTRCRLDRLRARAAAYPTRAGAEFDRGRFLSYLSRGPAPMPDRYAERVTVVPLS
jgi:hypothetical protein